MEKEKISFIYYYQKNSYICFSLTKGLPVVLKELSAKRLDKGSSHIQTKYYSLTLDPSVSS